MTQIEYYLSPMFWLLPLGVATTESADTECHFLVLTRRVIIYYFTIYHNTKRQDYVLCIVKMI